MTKGRKRPPCQRTWKKKSDSKVGEPDKASAEESKELELALANAVKGAASWQKKQEQTQKLLIDMRSSMRAIWLYGIQRFVLAYVQHRKAQKEAKNAAWKWENEMNTKNKQNRDLETLVAKVAIN